jgi:hypothetical protein
MSCTASLLCACPAAPTGVFAAGHDSTLVTYDTLAAHLIEVRRGFYFVIGPFASSMQGLLCSIPIIHVLILSFRLAFDCAIFV